jgi:hypothetical protein
MLDEFEEHVPNAPPPGGSAPVHTAIAQNASGLRRISERKIHKTQNIMHLQRPLSLAAGAGEEAYSPKPGRWMAARRGNEDSAEHQNSRGRR